MLRRPGLIVLCLSVTVVVGLLGASTTKGHRTRFSPKSLRLQRQSEVTVLFGELPIYRGSWNEEASDVLEYIQDAGLVQPVTSHGEEWISLCHCNSAWKDGRSPLVRTFNSALIEWSRAYPKVANVYWREIFLRLRSGDERDREFAGSLATMGKNAHEVYELRQLMEIIEKDMEPR